MKEAWEKQYKEKSAPWNYDGFDEDFRKFLKIRFSEDCTVIDLGCGNGSQVHHIEKLGFEVTGTDVVNPGAAGKFYCLAGHMSSTSTASHISKTEVVRDTESFSDIIRGLHIFGRKVLRKESLALGVVN